MLPGDNHPVSIDLVTIFQRHDRTFADSINAFGLALAQAGAAGDYQIENGAVEVVRVGDLETVRRKHGMAELGRETRLKFLDFGAADALEGETGAFLFVPVPAGGIKTCLTVVKIERSGFRNEVREFRHRRDMGHFHGSEPVEVGK